jgi:5-methylcytosine-specific restriction endonuclease McrA
MAGPRSNRRYTQMREALKRKRLPCWLCGLPIDYAAAKGEPLSFTADHVQPITTHPDLALDPTNLKPCHHRCNSRRQDGPPKPDVGAPSRPW